MELEDDSHVLAGCSVTGSSDWLIVLVECWNAVATQVAPSPSPPPTPWLEQHRLQLLAALIPSDISSHLPLPPASSASFRRHLHHALAERTAEHLRRRQQFIISLPASSSSPSAAPPLQHPCPLPADRQLSLTVLRHLETARRADILAPASSASSSTTLNTAPSSSSAVPPASGAHRMTWLRSHLVALLRDSTVACPAPFGASTLDILALFEETFHEPFSETPGAVVGARVRAIAKVLALIARDSSVGLELKTTMKSRLVHWSRRLKVPVASLEWRRRIETLEASHPKALHSRHCMAHADAQLALWIRSHEFLVPAEVVSGECSMALLILWEVDHGRSFPTQAGENPSHVVLGFTKRLKRQVSSDPELKEWLVWKDVFTSLSPGLPNLRHTRWAVRLKPPLGPSPAP